MSSGKDFVLLFPDSAPMLQHRLQFILLDHPRGMPTLFAVHNDSLYELQRASPRRHAAWFVDQNVSSDGSIYIANIIDPRLLLLPILDTALKFSPINQLIFDHRKENSDPFPISVLKTWSLDDICDVNDKLGEDMVLHRLNEDKCLRWLEGKVERCAAKLREVRQRENRGEDTNFVSGFNISHQQSSEASADAMPLNSPIVSGVSSGTSPYNARIGLK